MSLCDYQQYPVEINYNLTHQDFLQLTRKRYFKTSWKNFGTFCFFLYTTLFFGGLNLASAKLKTDIKGILLSFSVYALLVILFFHLDIQRTRKYYFDFFKTKDTIKVSFYIDNNTINMSINDQKFISETNCAEYYYFESGNYIQLAPIKEDSAQLLMFPIANCPKDFREFIKTGSKLK
jgi:hypothetical protein